jgi:uncharacterized membrane protein YcaP (DUF421 family)
MEFDRIFLGDLTVELVIEIVLRTAVMYLYTLALVRVLGKRGLGQLSPFELVIIVALGSAVGDPMFYTDVPVAHGIIVITAVVALERTLVKLTERHKEVERLIESVPVLLVRDGVLLADALNQEDLSQNEVFMGLRDKGVEYLGEVRRAYLEPSGHISVFKEKTPATMGASVLPDDGGKG